MKKHIIISMAAVVALVLISSVVMAYGPRHAQVSGYGPGYGYPRISNLTQEQTSKIRTIQDANFKSITPLQDQLFTKRTELRDLWRAQNPDRARINALQADIRDLQAQLQEKATDARLEMRKILTPEQQAQLTTYGPRTGKKAGRMGCW